MYFILVAIYVALACSSFVWFGAVTYGKTALSASLVHQLKWFETWDFLASVDI